MGWMRSLTMPKCSQCLLKRRYPSLHYTIQPPPRTRSRYITILQYYNFFGQFIILIQIMVFVVGAVINVNDMAWLAHSFMRNGFHEDWYLWEDKIKRVNGVKVWWPYWSIYMHDGSESTKLQMSNIVSFISDDDATMKLMINKIEWFRKRAWCVCV